MVRKINAKLVLRLRAEGFSLRQIEAQGISQHSSIKVERAAAREHLTWETAAGMTENEVYERLFPGVGVRESAYVQPDWPVLHRELARVGVTLKLLHAEYLDRCQYTGAPGMGYDRFCKTYAAYVRAQGGDFQSRSQGGTNDRGRLVRSHDAAHEPDHRADNEGVPFRCVPAVLKVRVCGAPARYAAGVLAGMPYRDV